jgi:AraC family transcriptional regulator, arabinose operon regulatory protein
VERPLDRRIAQSIQTMEQRLAERQTVSQLAALVNLSPSRFAHLFRRTTGMSPVRYLHDLRMRRAQTLLQETSLPVGEVMRLVGWGDPSHFSKAFRRRFGVGPRDYRHASGPAVGTSKSAR